MSESDDFHSLLVALASTTRQRDAAGFVARCEAIDRLELHLPDASEMHAPGPDCHLRSLRDRGAALCRQFEAINATMVAELRADIAFGRCRGAALMDMLQSYRCHMSCDANTEETAYDALDVLVAGLLGIDQVRDADTTTTLPEMVAYQPTPVRIVLDLLNRVALGADDVFVDLGAGLGIVPILVALLRPASTIGVEIQPGYCELARACARAVNATRVAFVCADARDADFSTGTVFYLYTPFRGAVLRDVLARLQHEATQRPILICAYGPIVTELTALKEDWRFAELPAIGRSSAIFCSTGRRSR